MNRTEGGFIRDATSIESDQRRISLNYSVKCELVEDFPLLNLPRGKLLLSCSTMNQTEGEFNQGEPLFSHKGFINLNS